MDSSSDFGPVGKGFMVFHFCKILGAFGKMQKMCFQALFEVIFINHRRTKNSAGINLANRAQANKTLSVGNYSKNDVNKSKQTLRSFLTTGQLENREFSLQGHVKHAPVGAAWCASC